MNIIITFFTIFTYLHILFSVCTSTDTLRHQYFFNMYCTLLFFFSPFSFFSFIGDPSESDQHAIVDVFGICSVPTLDGLPADGDLHFGNVEEGRTRRSMLAVYNSDISTSTVTMEVDVRCAD